MPNDGGDDDDDYDSSQGRRHVVRCLQHGQSSSAHRLQIHHLLIKHDLEELQGQRWKVPRGAIRQDLPKLRPRNWWQPPPNQATTR